jgi:hypothetical protein
VMKVQREVAEGRIREARVYSLMLSQFSSQARWARSGMARGSAGLVIC